MSDTINNSALCYLATPYSKFPAGLEAAFNDAAKIAGDLMCAGINAYSPIVHSHPVAIACGLDPLDHKIWLPANQRMMEACDTLIVATMESWEASYGIAHELDWYRKQRRRIFWLDPVSMVMRKETPPSVIDDGDDDRKRLLTALARLADLDGQIPCWGAAVGAMDEERKGLLRFIDRHRGLAHGKTPSQHAGTRE